MRIATWNLDHRAGKGRVTPPSQVVQVLRELDLELVVLTELVPRRSPGLDLALKETELSHVAHSDFKGRAITC